MAWSFGDGFDLYAASADAVNGYWDSGAPASVFIAAGRFAGSQAIRNNGVGTWLTKSSNSNDAVHHIVCAFQQTAAISGSTLGLNFQLLDGTTGQCAIVFRSDGAILLTSGSAAGTTLATYAGAFLVINTWYAFEMEVVINNTTGRFRVRKNGNTVDDFDSGATLNTRGGTANNYANKLTLAMQASVTNHVIDDLFWRSDASSVPWMGDIRCYTRMPASDQSVQFSRTPTAVSQNTFTGINSFASTNVAYSFYTPITTSFDGTVGTVTITLNAGFTGNLKCSVFNDTAGVPSTVRSSATTVTNPVTGSNVFTFSTPFAVAKGTQYWIGFAADGTYSNAFNLASAANVGKQNTSGAYATFPVASPSTSAMQPIICSWAITLSGNWQVVSETQQDATTSYVYDSTVNDADFYGIASIASTPVSTIAVTTRGYMLKSDAGTRTAAVQLKSGASTVASPTLTLTTSGWQWAWRTDTVDPNTSAAWGASAVNNAQIGPRVVA